MSQKVAIQLKWWRTGRGLTQQQLANRAEVHTVQISQLERGKGNPTLATLERIASALGATLTVRFDAPNPENPEVQQWKP
jgi:transcriptional regulator with XRE-family HTH domain